MVLFSQDDTPKTFITILPKILHGYNDVTPLYYNGVYKYIHHYIIWILINNINKILHLHVSIIHKINIYLYLYIHINIYKQHIMM